jgi:hypothetical protein
MQKERIAGIIGLLVLVGAFAALAVYTQTGLHSSSTSTGQEYSFTVTSVVPHSGATFWSNEWITTTTYTLANGLGFGSTCSLSIGQAVSYVWTSQNTINILRPANCPVYSTIIYGNFTE